MMLVVDVGEGGLKFVVVAVVGWIGAPAFFVAVVGWTGAAGLVVVVVRNRTKYRGIFVVVLPGGR
jgi:hypothetical protein